MNKISAMVRTASEALNLRGGIRHRRRRGPLLIVGVLGLGGVLAVLLARPGRDPWPPRRVIALPEISTAAGFSADGQNYQTTNDHGVSAWDLATGRRILPGPEAWVDHRSLSSDRRSFVGMISDRLRHQTVVLGDAATGTIQTRIPLGERWILHVELVDEDRNVRGFVVDRTNVIEMVTWDRATGRETTGSAITPAIGRPEHALRWQGVFSPDGRTLAYVDTSRTTVQFWDCRANQPLGDPLQSPANSAVGPYPRAWSRVIFTPDGQTLLAGTNNGQVEFWEVTSHRLIKTLQLHPHDHNVYSLAVSPDGRLLGSSGVQLPARAGVGAFFEAAKLRVLGHGSYGEVQEAALTELDANRPLARFEGCIFGGFSPDGRMFVTCELGKSLSIRSLPPPSNR